MEFVIRGSAVRFRPAAPLCGDSENSAFSSELPSALWDSFLRAWAIKIRTAALAAIHARCRRISVDRPPLPNGTAHMIWAAGMLGVDDLIGYRCRPSFTYRGLYQTRAIDLANGHGARTEIDREKIADPSIP